MPTPSTTTGIPEIHMWRTKRSSPRATFIADDDQYEVTRYKLEQEKLFDADEETVVVATLDFDRYVPYPGNADDLFLVVGDQSWPVAYDSYEIIDHETTKTVLEVILE